MFNPVEATMGRYSRCSDQTAGASHTMASGRATAEAVEDFPRFIPQQPRLHSFSSSAADKGSVEVRDIPSVDLAQFKDPAPTAYLVASSNNWSATGISEDPVAVKDVAASKPVTKTTDVELCRKAQAAPGAAAAQDSRFATTAAIAVVPDECLTSEKPGRRKLFSSLQGRTCSAKTAAHLGPVAQSTVGPPHPRKPAPRPPLPAKATAAATAAVAVGPTPTVATPPSTLWPYIQQHGRGIMSISTLQDGLQYFVIPGVGYIAYSWMNNGPDFLNILTPVGLGDPICAVSDYSLMASEFLKKHPKAMFLQIGKEFGLIVRGLGMLVNSVGGETQLDLAKYTFSGYAKRGLRSAISSAVKEGITVQEVMKAPMGTQYPHGPAGAGDVQKAVTAEGVTSAVECARIATEMIGVDKTWVKNKGSHAGQVWFVNRPPVFAPEPGVRKFTARDRNGTLLAFIFFDAVYEQGNITGYYANVTRMKPDAHPGALNLIMSKFIDTVRSESQLIAPAKNLSVKKSQRKQKKQQQQPQHQDTAPEVAAAAAAAAAASTLPTGSSSNTASPMFLSLGLSPLHQIQDGEPFSYSRFVHRLFEFSFNQGSGYYPFRSLAAAKAKYGAGLHDGVYEDPNVTYQQVYLAHTHRRTACATMFDLGKMLGFWNSPWDAAVSFSGHKLSDGRRLVTNKIKRITKKSKRSNSNSSGGSSGGSSSIKRVGSGKGSAAVSTSSSRSGTQSKVSDRAPDRFSAASVISSCDSGDDNWRSRCLMLNFSRKKQYDLDTVPGNSGTTAAAAADGTKDTRTGPTCSSSSNRSKPCIFRKGRVLLPIVRPVKPHVPAAGSAAAAAAADKRGAPAPAGCSADPEFSSEMTCDASETSSGSGSGYIGTAACPTSAPSSSQGSSTPITQD